MSAHAALIDLAQKWLWKQGCSIVVTDMTHGGRETPDAIGFYGAGSSILVECKASRADFRTDAKKPFRRDPQRGMGKLRYYLAPKGVICEDDLPEKWGLIEAHDGKLRVAIKAQPQHHYEGAREELQLLISCIRRIGPLEPPGVNVKFYTTGYYDAATTKPKQRATLGVALTQVEFAL